MGRSLPGSSVQGISQATKLEWVTTPFSVGSSWLGNQTHISCVSCIAGRFFSHWAIKEAHLLKAWWLKSTKLYILIISESWNSERGQHRWSLVRNHCVVCRQPPSHCVFTWQRERASCLLSLLIRALIHLSSLVAQRLKHLPPMRETQVWSLGQEDPLEKEMVTHSSIFAWRIPWMRSLVGYSPQGHKELDTTGWLHLIIYT